MCIYPTLLRSGGRVAAKCVLVIVFLFLWMTGDIEMLLISHPRSRQSSAQRFDVHKPASSLHSQKSLVEQSKHITNSIPIVLVLYPRIRILESKHGGIPAQA
jgi:hypothetical protein